MSRLIKILGASPARVRVAPFVIFLALTFLQGQFGEPGRYWIYLFKTFVGAWFLWTIRPLIPEMRWSFSWEGLVAGAVVFAAWVGLDGLYPKMSSPGQPWNPVFQFGAGSMLAGFFVAVRVIGSTLVVPPLEEVFYRSFLYRYIAKPNFESVGFGEFLLKPFVVTALVFGAAHYEWLAGILCAVVFQGLVLRKKRLGDAILAHAVANLLLGLWVAGRGAWQFW